MHNPYEFEDRDGLNQDDPIHCHFCGGYLGDGHDPRLPAGVVEYNGHHYCADHSPIQAVEDLARSHRMDEERDDFNRVRR